MWLLPSEVRLLLLGFEVSYSPGRKELDPKKKMETRNFWTGGVEVRSANINLVRMQVGKSR